MSKNILAGKKKNQSKKFGEYLVIETTTLLINNQNFVVEYLKVLENSHKPQNMYA